MSKIILPERKLLLPSRRKLLKGLAATAIGAPFIIGKAKSQIVAPALFASSQAPAPSPFALIAHAITNDSGVTPSVNATGANLGVVVVAYYTGGGAGVANVTDNSGHAYTLVQAYSVSGDSAVAIYYLQSGSIFGVGYTVAVNPNVGSIYAVLELSLWSGSIASPLDQQNGFASASVTTIQSGSVTPSNTNQLIIAGASANNGASASIGSIDSGFTLLDKAAQDANQIAGGAAYLLQTSAVAANPTWTLGSSSTAAAALATFRSV